MFDQLDIVEERYEQLNELLSDPEVVSDSNLLRKYSKEQSELQKTVEVYRQYKQVKEDAEEIELMLAETDDADEVEMLKEEASALKAEVPELEEQLKLLLIPKDPNDEKDVIVEIRGLQVAMKRLFLLVIYSVCILSSLSHIVLNLKL